MGMEIKNISSCLSTKISQKKSENNTNKIFSNNACLINTAGALSFRNTTMSTIAFKGNHYNQQGVEVSVSDLYSLINKPDECERISAIRESRIYVKPVLNENNNRKFKGIAITNHNDAILAAVSKGSKSNPPNVDFKEGKYKPTLSIKDPASGLEIVMVAGSQLHSEDLRISMPGLLELPHTNKQTVPFMSGKAFVSLYNLEEKTMQAVENYAGLGKSVIKGDYAGEFDANIGIQAGGLGERYKNYTGNDHSKPEAPMPGGYPLISIMAQKAFQVGIGNDFAYLSEAGSIPEKKDKIIHINKDKKPLGDAGAYAAAIKNGTISFNKPFVAINADAFSNVDITRAYHLFKQLPDAAILLPYYPMTRERISSFGNICAHEENGNLVVDEFVEKPDSYEKLQKAEKAKILGTNIYMINPGVPYILSKEAVKLLGEKAGTKINLYEFVTEIVDKCKKGELKNAEGKPLKVYTCPMETHGGRQAVWDDIGTIEAATARFRDVAYEYKQHGQKAENKYYGIDPDILKSINKNVDLNTGIVYASKEAREKFKGFCKKYGITEAKGNIYVKVNV